MISRRSSRLLRAQYALVINQKTVYLFCRTFKKTSVAGTAAGTAA